MTKPNPPTETKIMTPHQWSDLPRRLSTILIGLPLIIVTLSHRTASIIFFQGVHLLCTIEWLRLIPTTATSSSSQSSLNRNNYVKKLPKTCCSVISFPILSIILSFSSSTDVFLFRIYFFMVFIYLLSYIDLFFLSMKYKSTAGNTYSHNSDSNINTSSTNTSAGDAIPLILENHRLQYVMMTQHIIFGLLYLSTSFYFWIQLCSKSFTHTIYLLCIVWNCDTGALVFGRVGKSLSGLLRRLFSSTDKHDIVDDNDKQQNNNSDDVIGIILQKCIPGGTLFTSFVKFVSPKKSITGFVGGVVFGAWTAVKLPEFIYLTYSRIVMMKSIMVFSNMELEQLWENQPHLDVHSVPQGILDFESISFHTFSIDIPMSSSMQVFVNRLLVGITLSILAILGDFIESTIKRNSGKKDSGKLLPGHGGILDRFDSTFLSVVVYVTCFYAIGSL